MSELAKIQEIQELAEDRFRRHWAEAQRLGRKTVEEAWRAGKALMKVNEAMLHGGWGEWLEGEDIARRTAYRLIELAKRAPELCQIGTFATVDEALKDLPALVVKPRRRPAPPKPEPEPDWGLSPAEETKLQLEAETARADTLRSVRTELAEANDQIDVMEKSGGDSAKGMVARSDYETLNKEYLKTRALLKKRDWRIKLIKRALLNGQTADEVLSRYFRLARSKD